MDLADIRDVSIFAEQVGSQFHVETATGQRIAATLIEADSLGNRAGGDQPVPLRPFSLLFEVAEDCALPQSTYQVHHEYLGTMALFLVPIGSGKLESVFN